MSASVTVRHNFETAHRLPFLGGKCENLHGHSWWVEVTATTEAATDTVVEFGAFKKGLRGWIDAALDHGVMLGAEDPLSLVLPQHGKTFLFGETDIAHDLMWPTVENVARLLGRVAIEQLDSLREPDARITRVDVTETHVNRATWTPATAGWSRL